MARYIDADALLNELKEELEFDSPMYNEVENKWLNKGLRIAINDVKRFSTADVAPRAEVAREIFDELEEILCGEFLTERFWFDLGKLRIKHMEGQK